MLLAVALLGTLPVLHTDAATFAGECLPRRPAR